MVLCKTEGATPARNRNIPENNSATVTDSFFMKLFKLAPYPFERPMQTGQTP